MTGGAGTGLSNRRAFIGGIAAASALAGLSSTPADGAVASTKRKKSVTLAARRPAVRRIDLTVPLPPGPWLDEVKLAATLYLPSPARPGTPVLFLFPGGGGTRGYFDIHVPGLNGYSQAEHHAANGFIVVTVDHLGTGQSSLPPDDQLAEPVGSAPNPRFRMDGPFKLETMAAAINGVAGTVMSGLRTGTIAPGIGALQVGIAIGAGHSLGGHILALAQANHEPFAGVAFFGSSFTQTRLRLLPGRTQPPRNAPASTIFESLRTDADRHGTGFFGQEEAAVIAFDQAGVPWRTRWIPRDSGRAMLPSAFAREAASIRCPVLLGYGQLDVTADPAGEVATFRSSADISLYVAPRMGHSHNLAPTRQLQWRRFEQFARRLAEDSAA